MEDLKRARIFASRLGESNRRVTEREIAEHSKSVIDLN
jgi:hypothetical protein